MYRILLLISIGLTAMLSAAESSPFIGTWHGSMAIGQQSLPLVLHVSDNDGTTNFSLDSPLQGAKDIQAEGVISGDSISVNIPMISAKYTGVLSSGSISGTFSQRGFNMPLTLEPGDYIPPRPQTPQPPFAYEVRQVHIFSPIDSTLLDGTLTLPAQYDMPMFKDLPMVVMVTGSGVQDRDETILGHKPFAVIADHLAKCGIASLRYDDRGYGIEEYPDTVTTPTYAADACAAVNFARSYAKIGKVGVLGHSEGGMIAMMLAADGAIDFAVSMAGPALRGDSLLAKQNYALLSPQLGAEQAQKYADAMLRVLQYTKDNPGVTSLPDDFDFGPDCPMVDNLKALVAHRTPWIDWFIAYDPMPAIAKTNIPVMILNGSLDMQVPPQSNLPIYRDNLPKNDKNLIKEYHGLNHLMQNASTGSPSEYSVIEETISPEVLSDIANWISGISKKGK